MIHAFLLLLPASVCFFWMLLYPLLISKKNTFGALMFLLLATGLYFLADSGYASPFTTNKALTINSLIAQLAAPSIIPLLIIYLRKIGNTSTLKHIHLIWAVVPFILFTGELTMIILYGADNIERYLDDMYTYGIEVADMNSGYAYHTYYIWAVIVFRVVIAIEISLLLVYFALLIKHRGLPLRYLPAFLFHKGNVKVLGMTVALLYALMLLGVAKILMSRNFLMTHPFASLTTPPIIALLIFFMLYIGLYSDRDTITLEEMRKGFHLEDESRPEAASKDKSHIMSSIIEVASGDKNSDALLARFHRIVVDQQMFLQPQLTITDVADRMGTNKTYISRLVNNSYHMPFPDLINALKVDYTQRYLINHHNATQVEVAKACGFSSASALNNTFKKVTGMTPKIWLATRNKKQSH
jgi:AraC-like DNA-binding protein